MKIWITTETARRVAIDIGKGCVIELSGRNDLDPSPEPVGIATPWGWIYFDDNSRLYALKIDSEKHGQSMFGQTSPMLDPLPGEKKDEPSN
jgi:hypothetical protein